ncbi:MAG: hypothetical protein GEV06_22955 [Luteitalea sp.]|nr:hypothetical protein [Luteitalea sp.]
MRRLLAALLGVCLLSVTAQGATLHVHLYGDHDHPEHHHGLAAHHHGTGSHPHDSGVRLEQCDPGQHVVSLTLALDPTLKVPAPAAEPVTAVLPMRGLYSCGAVPLIDLREHGPPPVAGISPRAPPALIPAC